MDLDLRYVTESSIENVLEPAIKLDLFDLTSKGHLGPSVSCNFSLVEGQAVTFVLRTPPKHVYPEATKPSQKKAEDLGIPFDSMYPSLVYSVNSDTMAYRLRRVGRDRFEFTCSRRPLADEGDSLTYN